MTSPPVLIPKDAFFIFFLHGSSTRSGTQFRQEPPFPVRSNPICSPSRKELNPSCLSPCTGGTEASQSSQEERGAASEAGETDKAKNKSEAQPSRTLNCALTWRESVKGSLNSPCPKVFMNRSSVCPTKSSSPKLHYWERFTGRSRT